MRKCSVSVNVKQEGCFLGMRERTCKMCMKEPNEFDGTPLKQRSHLSIQRWSDVPALLKTLDLRLSKRPETSLDVMEPNANEINFHWIEN